MMRRNPVVGVDLDDVEHLGVERLGPRSRPEKRLRLRTRRSPRVAMTVDVTLAIPRSAMACISAITASRPGRIPAFTTRRRSSGEMSSASSLRHRVPVAGREARPEAVGRSACGVFQSRRRPTELVEPRERGVDVGLVEDLDPADQVAFDRQKIDHPPLGVEALLRGPVGHVGDDRSEVAQPMHGLDAMLRSGVRSHAARIYCGHLTGRDPVPAGDRQSPSPPSPRRAHDG